MRPPSLARARAPGGFYGWWMVALCTIARGFTAPGQTIGISAFIDDLIDDLATSRSGVATAYLVGTLAGAIVLPFVGRWVDRAGVRRTMLIVSGLFGFAILFASTVQNVVLLGVAFLGLRMLGQGSLHLIAVQGIVIWFEQRRGFALAVSGIGALLLLSSTPLLFTFAINRFGWRTTWVILALGLWAVLIPIARYGIVDRPEVLGQAPDGERGEEGVELRVRSATVSEALRVPAFWTLAGVALLAGAVVTALTFHNFDMLAERGLSESQASAIFIPQMIGGASASFVVGWLTDRAPARPLIFAAAALLATGTFLATVAEPGMRAVLYGTVIGLAGGTSAATSAALLPKWFGVDHIGAIRGLATTANVGASALGPLLLSLGKDAGDSYGPVIRICALVCLVMAVIVALVPTPDGAATASSSHDGRRAANMGS